MEEKKYYRLGIGFLLALALFSPLINGGDSWQTALWLRPLIIGFGIFFCFTKTRGERFELKTPAQSWMILALVICLSASLALTHYYYITLYWYFTFLICLLLFFLGLQLFSGPAGPNLISALILIFFFAGLMQSLAGMVQYLSHPLDRVSGTFFNPAYYAGYLSSLLAFPLAGLSFDLFPNWPARKKLGLRIGGGILCALIFAGMLVSASRSIIFAVIPLGLILVIRFRVKGLLVIIALLLAVAVIPNPLRTRLLNLSQDPYAWERVGVWKTSVKMIYHHPQGVGLGMYGYYSQRYAEPFPRIKYGRYGLHATQAHNEFLNFAAECSLLLPILALAFLIVIFRRVFLAMRNSRADPKIKGRLAGFSASLLAILGHSLVDYNLHQPPIMILAALDLACLIALLAQADSSALNRREITFKRPLRFRIFLLGLGIPAIIFTGGQSLLEASFFRALSDEDHSRAITRLLRLSQIPSGYAPIYFHLGGNFERAFEHTGDEKWAGPALAFLSQAARRNPENQEYFYELARAESRLGTELKRPGFLEESVKNAEKATRLAPGQVFSYLLISDIYLSKKDYSGARQILQTALSYEPYFFQARGRLIRILVFEKNFEQAKKELDLLLSQHKEFQEFEKAHPKLLNYYQKQIVAMSEDEIRRLSALAE